MVQCLGCLYPRILIIETSSSDASTVILDDLLGELTTDKPQDNFLELVSI